MTFEQVKAWLRVLALRIALVCTGVLVVAISLSVNRNAGHAIVAGLLSPDSPEAIVMSVARLLLPTTGLWLMYRGLR